MSKMEYVAYKDDLGIDGTQASNGNHSWKLLENLLGLDRKDLRARGYVVRGFRVKMPKVYTPPIEGNAPIPYLPLPEDPYIHDDSPTFLGLSFPMILALGLFVIVVAAMLGFHFFVKVG